MPARGAGGSWLSVSSERIAVTGSPGRASTLSNIEWVTAKCEPSGSGSAAASNRSWVALVHETKPSGGFLRCTRRRFFSSSPALASNRTFSTSCSGACTTTVPAVS